MSQDRRESRRTSVTLPFRWLPLPGPEPLADVCERLGLPAYARIQGRLDELESELGRALEGVAARDVAAVLHLLNAKVGLLEEALSATLPLPGRQALELSADGVAFAADAPLPPGSWLGVHLVLPSGHHVVGAAEVSHCEAAAGAHRVGTRFGNLEPAAEKRLTRFIIRSK